MINGLINFLMDDVLQNSLITMAEFFKRKKRLSFFDEEIINFSAQMNPLQSELNDFIYHQIIFKCAGNDVNHINKNIIRKLFKNYLIAPQKLPPYIQKRISQETGVEKINWQGKRLSQSQPFIRIVADHIAGMTDNYAKLQLEEFDHEN
ncbi:MAG TPA: hypothetical protein ENN22_05030 [bacterium]|nr:hypothetical protein [bacterium]